MLKIIFKNAKVLIMETDKLQDLQVEVENNLITYVGANRTAEGEIIDCKGCILLPAFINMCGFDTNADSENENRLTSDQISQLCRQYIQTGIGTVADNFTNCETAKIYAENGLRYAAGLSAVDADCENRYEQLNKEFRQSELANQYNNNALKKPFCFVPAKYALDENEILQYLKFTRRNNLKIGIHLSETLEEVGECDKIDNCTPIAMCEKLGCFDLNAIAFHCVHTDKDDLEILAYNNVSVVACPSSDAFKANGIAPVYAMLKKGINVCIGTNGANFKGKIDMFNEMYLIYILQRLYTGEKNCIKPFDILKMATVNAAIALKQDNSGKIKENFLADIILVDTSSFLTESDLVDGIVCKASAKDVCLNMVNGKIIYKR